MATQQKPPTLDEQETTFTVEATDRNTVHVFSNDGVWQKRMERLGIEPFSTDGYGMFYKVSLEDFLFGFRKRRVLSEEQRREIAERFAAARDGGSDDTEYPRELGDEDMFGDGL